MVEAETGGVWAEWCTGASGGTYPEDIASSFVGVGWSESGGVRDVGLVSSGSTDWC